MNYNPYSPPDASGSALAAPVVDGQPQTWTATEAISLAFERFKDGWPVLVGSYFLVGFSVWLVQQLATVLLLLHVVEPKSAAYFIVLGAGVLVGQLVSAFLNVGLIRIWLAAARGQPLSFGVLFSGAETFLPLFGLELLIFGIVCFGLLLFIVPGIILGLGLFAAPFYMVDADIGPVEAMKASWNVCRGRKGDLFGFGLATFGVVFLGVLACCVGVFVAAPICAVASAIVFVRLTGRGVARLAPAEEPAQWAAPPAE